jgi:hypothetical protein
MTEGPIPSTADFWCSLGHNVIPARGKKPIEDWKRWQYEQIPKSQHEVWKYNHSFDSGMMVMLGKSWVNSQYLWVAISLTGIITYQQCTNCNRQNETYLNYCWYCRTKQKNYDCSIERTLLDKLLDIETNYTTSTYQMKYLVDMYSLLYGFNGPLISAERIFIIFQYSYKLYLYGYCKEPFPDTSEKLNILMDITGRYGLHL